MPQSSVLEPWRSGWPAGMGCRTSRKRLRHRCSTRSVDPDLRTNLGCTFQPRRYHGRCYATGTAVARCSCLRGRTGLRRICGRCGSKHNVWLAALFASHHARHGGAQIFSEFIATFGLLSVIWGCSRVRSYLVAFAVGAYISAAIWFTPSTSFANPAVTLARAASDTFVGIRPADAPAFIVGQLLGAAAATLMFRWLIPALPATASAVVIPIEIKED